MIATTKASSSHEEGFQQYVYIPIIFQYGGMHSLEWRHNEPDGVSNHQPHDCLLNRNSDSDQRKDQSSASLAFVRGFHWWPVNSPQKEPGKRKLFPFDDVILLTNIWWGHHMITLSASLALCQGKPPVTSGVPSESESRVRALMFTLMSAKSNCRTNNRGDF